jgi:hypothetical protein
MFACRCHYVVATNPTPHFSSIAMVKTRIGNSMLEFIDHWIAGALMLEEQILTSAILKHWHQEPIII